MSEAFMPGARRVRRHQTAAVAALGAVALLAGACGSDDSSSDAGSETTATTAAAAESTAAPESSSETTAAAEAGADGYKVAYLSASSANTWLASSLVEMEKVAAANNVEIVEFDAQFDPAKQATQFQDVIAAGGYDGVILVSLTGIASEPDIMAATEAGMKVVVLNQVVGEDFTTADPQVAGVSASVMSPPYQNGRRFGELTVKACENVDPCKVAYIYGLKGTPLDEALRSGFDDVTAEHPNITVVAEGEGKYLGPDGGITATQDILQIASDVNVIVGADQSMQGAAIVLGDEGRSDIKLIGQGGSEPALEGIRNGTWFGGVFGAPADEGRVAMEAMVQVLSGGGDFGGYDPLTEAPENGTITADNVDQFTAQWAG
ncbi:MAG: sugar ABC transporter substrate-binding protein [Ilumatobacteraceae bacterium]